MALLYHLLSLWFGPPKNMVMDTSCEAEGTLQTRDTSCKRRGYRFWKKLPWDAPLPWDEIPPSNRSRNYFPMGAPINIINSMATNNNYVTYYALHLLINNILPPPYRRAVSPVIYANSHEFCFAWSRCRCRKFQSATDLCLVKTGMQHQHFHSSATGRRSADTTKCCGFDCDATFDDSHFCTLLCGTMYVPL